MCGVPDTHRAVLAGGDESLAIRRPGNGGNSLIGSREEQRATGSVPDLCCPSHLIDGGLRHEVLPGDDARPIRRSGEI